LQHEKPSAVRTDVEGAAVIAVASGAGLREVFEQLGAAYVIDGGQTLNPSTGDFLEGIDALPNTDVILLPNNKNILLAARQAAESAHHKNIAVVPTTTLPQGISAMFEYTNFTPDDPFGEIVDAMTAMLSSVHTCEITTATRSVDLEGVSVRQGEWIGLLDDVLVVAGDDMTALVLNLLEKAEADKFERITLYYGAQSDAAQAAALAERLKQRFTGQDVEIVSGGQALYPYIISVE
jgi:dihydroxyacetone kinase-like predicted kinase